MRPIDQYQKEIELINEFFNEDKSRFKIIEHGWSNLIIEVDDKYIFRFLKNKVHTAQRQAEIDILNVLKNKISLKIPKLLSSTSLYLVYEKIHGIPLTNQVLHKCDVLTRKKIAIDLALFLSELHSVKDIPSSAMSFPYGGDNFWEDIWEPIARKLSKKNSDQSKKYFENYFEKCKEIELVFAITHCDLGTNNILFDYDENRVAGIIDFGDVAVGDIARDFNGIYRHHGKEFTKEVMSLYSGELGSLIWDRVEYYAIVQKWFVYYYTQAFNQLAYRDLIIDQISDEFEQFKHQC